MNPNFPPFLNNNYTGIDPVAGFDFYLQYGDKNVGRFMKCDMQIRVPIYANGGALIDLTIGEGIIDHKTMEDILNVSIEGDKPRVYRITKSPEFTMMFESYRNSICEGYYSLCDLRMHKMHLGIMPGRRVAVIEIKASARTLEFTKSD